MPLRLLSPYSIEVLLKVQLLVSFSVFKLYFFLCLLTTGILAMELI